MFNHNHHNIVYYLVLFVSLLKLGTIDFTPKFEIWKISSPRVWYVFISLFQYKANESNV